MRMSSAFNYFTNKNIHLHTYTRMHFRSNMLLFKKSNLVPQLLMHIERSIKSDL